MPVTPLITEENIKSASIPIKVILLCEVYRVIKENLRYLEFLNDEYMVGLDPDLVAEIKDAKLTLRLLDVQTTLGVQYAK